MSTKPTKTMKGIWLENKEIYFRDNLPMSFPDDEVIVKVFFLNIYFIIFVIFISLFFHYFFEETLIKF